MSKMVADVWKRKTVRDCLVCKRPCPRNASRLSGGWAHDGCLERVER